MKNTIKITGIVLMLVMAGSLSLNAQRGGMRGMMMDSTRMRMQGRGMMRPSATPGTATPGMTAPGTMMLRMRDTARMGMMRHNMDSMHMHMMRPMRQDMRGQMPGMRGRMGHMQGYGMHRGGMYGPQAGFGMRGMRPGMGMMYGNGRNMGRMPVNRMGYDNMRQGRPLIESIPNLTEKQKKDMADLRVKNQEEMKKFRDEIVVKMKSMRDANQAKMMNMLTDEQKKAINPDFGKKVTAPATKK